MADITRRKFLQLLGLGAVAAAVGGVTGVAEAEDAGTDERVDEHVDEHVNNIDGYIAPKPPNGCTILEKGEPVLSPRIAHFIADGETRIFYLPACHQPSLVDYVSTASVNGLNAETLTATIYGPGQVTDCIRFTTPPQRDATVTVIYGVINA